MLCKTSNSSSAEVQDLALQGGGRVYDKVSSFQNPLIQNQLIDRHIDISIIQTCAL